MTTRILDGRATARTILASVEARAQNLTHNDIYPKLAFVMHGASEEARLYARRLDVLCGRLGLDFDVIELEESTSPKTLLHRIECLDQDPLVDGVLIQMPLPEQLHGAHISTVLRPGKDVDGITVENAGRLYLELPGHAPSTALAMLQLLDESGVDSRGKHAVVVGRSQIVGHPVAELLLRRDATVTVTHRQTEDLAKHTRDADILMVAAGSAGLIRGTMIKPGVVIVDAGINPTEDGVIGDVVYDECVGIAAAITPVPGGVGPVTTACLLRSLIAGAETRTE